MQAAGHMAVSALDRQDGFIHLSSAAQLPATWARFFADHPITYIYRFHIADLSAHASTDLSTDLSTDRRRGLKWESSEDAELFPHFYGQLLVSASDQEYRIDRSDPGHLSTIGSLL